MKNKFTSIVVVTTLFISMCASAQTVYEAEGSQDQPVVLNAGASYKSIATASGGIAVGNFFELNSFLRFNFIDGGATGGAATIKIQYSNATGADATLTFHQYPGGASTAVSQVIFKPTLNASTFAEVSLNAILTPGIQSIKFQKIDPEDKIPGAGPNIDYITVTLGSLSVADFAKADKKQVNVFHNSAASKIDLSFNGFSKSNYIDVSIYSINGQLVFKEKSLDVNRMSINKSFTNGVYIIKVADNSATSITKKLIIKN